MPRRRALALTHIEQRPVGLNRRARWPSGPPRPACAPPVRGGGRRIGRVRFTMWAWRGLPRRLQRVAAEAATRPRPSVSTLRPARPRRRPLRRGRRRRRNPLGQGLWTELGQFIQSGLPDLSVFFPYPPALHPPLPRPRHKTLPRSAPACLRRATRTAFTMRRRHCPRRPFLRRWPPMPPPPRTSTPPRTRRRSARGC